MATEARRAPLSARIGMWLLRLGAKGFATAAFDQLPMGTVTGGGTRLAPRPGDEAMLRWYGESPWPHNKFLILCTAVADVTYRVGTLGGRGGEEFVELPADYPMRTLLDQPNPFFHGWDFLFLSALYLRGTGEVYWRAARDGLGRPRAVWVLPRHWVQPVRDRATNRVIHYRLAVRGESPLVSERERFDRIPPEDMLWIRTPDPVDPYLRGVGDMLSSATEVETFEHMSEADRRLMLNDARPPFYMKVPGAPPAEERKAMKDEFMRFYGGFWNAGNFPVMWGDAELKQFQVTKKELDFVESQRFLRDTIVAPVHKHLVGVTEDVNRANADAAEYVFARWHVRADVNRMARHLTILGRMFDRRVVVRADDPVPQDRALRSTEARDPGSGAVLLVDERRARLGEPPLPNGQGQVRILPITAVEVPVGEAGHGPEAAARGAGRPPEGTKALPDGTKQRRRRPPTLADLLRALPPEGELAAMLVRRLLGAYEAVMEGRWGSAAEEVGIDVAFDVAHPEVARFLREEAGSRIRGIDATTLDAVRAELAEGVQAGEPVTDIARRVSAVFDDAKGARAAVIARTETLYASNRAAFIAYGESGLVPKLEWLLAPDYTPEVDGGECEPFDGKVVEYGQEFAPGVPFPPLHPQCRCTIAPVFEGGRRLYDDERRKLHVTALGRTHARMERMFLNALRRALQEQQNAALRALRSAGQEDSGAA